MERKPRAKPKGEKEDFLNWTASTRYQEGDDYFRHNGAGEMLVFSAADYEDFRVERLAEVIDAADFVPFLDEGVFVMHCGNEYDRN